MELSRNHIVKVVRSILLLILILFIVDFSAGFIFKSVMKQQKDGRYHKILYSLEECKEDIVIIGSSRAESNYNPSVFTKNLGLSCWNAGRGGQGLPYILAIQQSILQRYNPKIMIINIDQNMLENPVDYDKAAILRPFSSDHPIIDSILSLKDWKEKYKLKSKIYCYNSSMYYFLRPFFIKNKDGKPEDKGWKPKFGSTITKSDMLKDLPNYDKTNELDKEAVAFFNKIIANAKKSDTRLIIVSSADILRPKIITNTIKYINQICFENKIEYYSFTEDASITEKINYFYDVQHMNNVGASIFSNKLCQSIKEI